MYRSLFMKEWLKTRWIIAVYAVISFVILVMMYYDIRHMITMNGAMKVWNYLVFKQVIYFKDLKYIPVAGGLALAIFQYVPESFKNRFRLSFHLPITEAKILLYMIAYGVIAILAVYVLILLGLYSLGKSFFPAELVSASVATSIPWLLAGLVTYLGAATTITEPNWYRRAPLALIVYFATNMFLQEYIFCQYSHTIGFYVLIPLLLVMTILFPGHRLRKGSK